MSVTFSAFSDIHLFAGRFIPDDVRRLDFILKRAEERNVDFIIHAGDFACDFDLCKEEIRRYNSFRIPTYHTLGNHEFEFHSESEILTEYQMTSATYFFDCKGFRFISVSTNSLCRGGEFIPYDHGNFFCSDNNFIAPKELNRLREALLSSPYPCVIFSHNDLGDSTVLKNSKDVLAVLDEAKNAGIKIPLCVSGHLHNDYYRIRNNTVFFGLNSCSYDWIDNADVNRGFYPEDLRTACPMAKHVLIYEKPVHAIVTLSEDGDVDIEGMEGDFLLGVDRTAIGYAVGHNMSTYTASVGSLHVRLR